MSLIFSGAWKDINSAGPRICRNSRAALEPPLDFAGCRNGASSPAGPSVEAERRFDLTARPVRQLHPVMKGDHIARISIIRTGRQPGLLHLFGSGGYLLFYTLLKEEDYLFPKYFKAGESVLDLACGMARTTLLLQKMGMRVCGIDRSEKFIEVAKQRFPDLDLRVGSFDAIGAEDASFDNIVIALNGIDLAIPESQRVAALRECTRVLKPGGI